MPSSLAKNIVLSRNLIDAEGEFDKSGEASAAFWLACGNTGISVLLCTTELERPGSPQIPAQSLADAVGFAGLSSSRAVLWHHLAHGFGPPQLSARLTYEPAHLPGLRVRTLYPRQCLACADAHLMGGKYGVPRPIAFASMTIELITKLAAGALIFAVSLLFWGDVGLIGKLLNGSPLIVVLGLVTIVALLVVLHPRVLGGLLNGALRLVKRAPVELTLRYSDILLVTLAWCASWLVAGIAFYVLLLALWPAAPPIALPICIGIEAMAWDI